MKIRINITREHIEKSANCNSHYPSNCLIACAIREIFPNAYVGYSHITPFNDLRNKQISLPGKAIIAIRVFDSSLPETRLKTEPFSFNIDVPHEIIDKIGIGEVYRVLSESRNLDLISI